MVPLANEHLITFLIVLIDLIQFVPTTSTVCYICTGRKKEQGNDKSNNFTYPTQLSSHLSLFGKLFLVFDDFLTHFQLPFLNQSPIIESEKRFN
jgi:hypothetical protein